MPTAPHSLKAKAASDSAREAAVRPEQSHAENSPAKKDLETLFREAMEKANSMSSEERREKYPFLKNFTGGPVPVDKGMQILEEMERKDAEIPDGTETSGPNNAS